MGDSTGSSLVKNLSILLRSSWDSILGTNIGSIYFLYNYYQSILQKKGWDFMFYIPLGP
jgi:hypothetical protein